MSAVSWRHDGRRIVIPVSVFAPEPVNLLAGVEGFALLDTGSTVSGIAERVAKALSLTSRGKLPLMSAQGEGQAKRYLFRVAMTPDRAEIDPPAYPFVFERVIGFELKDNFQFEALIGMDILRQCDLHMLRDGSCRLEFGVSGDR